MKKASLLCFLCSLTISGVCQITVQTINPFRPLFLLLGTLVLSGGVAFVSVPASRATSGFPRWGRYAMGVILGAMTGTIFTLLTVVLFWIGSWPITAGWIFGAAIGLASQTGSRHKTQNAATWKEALIFLAIAISTGLICGLYNPLLTR